MSAALLEWETRYSIGLEEIDDQHRTLLETINKIWVSIVQKSERAVVLGLVEELERYTIAHFAAEETFMRVANYPFFAEHKKEHQHFIARVAEEKRRAIETGTLSLDLMHFLRDWLIEHILVSDKKYADYLSKGPQKEKSLLGRFFSRLF